MLSGTVLNSDATLNNFQVIDQLEIFRGEEINAQFRIENRQLEIRYIPDVGAVVTFTFNTSSGTIDKVATLNTDDRSMATVNLSEAETAELLSGDIKFTVVEGTVTKKGLIVDGIGMVSAC